MDDNRLGVANVPANLRQRTLGQLLSPLCESTAELLKPLSLGATDYLAVASTKSLDKLILAPYAKTSLGPARASWKAATNRWSWRLPEAKLTTDGRVIVPATDFTVAVVESMWCGKISFADPEAELLWQYQVKSFQAGLLRTKIQAEYKKDKSLPDRKILLHDEYPLSCYQKAATLCSIGSEGYGLFMEQGTGKTACVISRMDQESAHNSKLYMAIIICPKSVRLNWQVELAKFSVSTGISHIMAGDKISRVKTICDAVRPVTDLGHAKNWSVVILSYGLMWRSMGILSQINWDLAVLDESHNIKNTLSKTAKGAMLLRDSSRQRMCLTGTPVANNLSDLYSQLEFMGKGFSGFSKYKSFRKYYLKHRISDSGYEVTTGVQNVPMLQERLARLSFIIAKREALPDLPGQVFDVISIDMTDHQKIVYKQVAERVVSEIEDELTKSSNFLVINSTLKRLMRLSEITSGFVKYDNVVEDSDGVLLPPDHDLDNTVSESGEIPPYILERFNPNPKLEALVEFLRERKPDEKTIVWAHFVQDIKTISARLDIESMPHVVFTGQTSAANRKLAEDRFNSDPLVRVFVGSAGAGGTGLNLLGHTDHLIGSSADKLSTSCQHMVYYSQDYSMLKRSQSQARNHRRGVRGQVRVVDLCVLGTVDQEMRERVLDKRKSAYEIQDIRSLLSKILESL